VEANYVAFAADVGIEWRRNDGIGSCGAARFNVVTDCGSSGFDFGAFGGWGGLFYGNVSARNTGDGALILTGTGLTAPGLFVIANTFDANGSDGLQMNPAPVVNFFSVLVENNIFSNNTGYGWNQTAGSQVGFNASPGSASHNCFYNNTAGTVPASRVTPTDSQTTDPTFTDAAGNNFAVGTNMKAFGAPTDNLANGLSSTRSFVDIGAAQREEAGGSGGLLTHPGMAGGMRG